MGELGGILLFVLFAAIAIGKKRAESEMRNPAPRPPQETTYEREKREYQEHVEEYNRNVESSKEALKGLKDGFVKLGEAVQEAAEEFKEEDTAPAVTYPHYESIRHSEGSFDASPAVKKRTLTSTTLRDDRKNDWMAKQLREERRIRNSTDLGAVHDDHCEAREIKTQHAAAHRAGRLDV